MKATRSGHKTEPMHLATVKTMTSKHACRAAVAERWRWQKQSLVVAHVVAVGIGTLICVSIPAAAQFAQQGNKLVGNGAIGTANQGYSVALSGEGNTAIMGGPYDNSEIGAAWVFTRSNGVWTQQGPGLAGNGAVGMSSQGSSVMLSADGNTAIVGGPQDNAYAGAAWVYTRANGFWTQQGNKLVGNNAVGTSFQGYSVTLSADGNTAIVGGPTDNGTALGSGIGAAWVFTRTNGLWNQQGTKLVGSGWVGAALQGSSVALSADGNTAIVGGPGDAGSLGAAWVFTRSNGTWAAQGDKLVGDDAVGAARQGYSVALSADGNTAVVGGPTDNETGVKAWAGAAWVFTRSNGLWSQQGSKLVGSGAVGTAEQGYSVTISANGNTAIVGGPQDNSYAGAAWVFTRTNGVWTQQAAKLVGSGAVGTAEQGYSVALSGDRSTAIVGGYFDNSQAGAAWVFVEPVLRPNTHDYNGDGTSDIAWRDTSGDLSLWLMNGAIVSSSGGAGVVPGSWSIVGQRDFDGDLKYDLLWRDTSGNTAMWFLNGTQVTSTAALGVIPTVWTVVVTADFDGDGKGDILWQDTSGDLAVWIMNGAAVSSTGSIGNVPSTWQVVGTGDFDGDGKADLLWRDGSGNTAIWFMNGTQVSSSVGFGNIPSVWSVAGTGDFDGDGMSDIVWQDSSGNISMWLMNGAAVLSSGGLGNVPITWAIVQTGDYDGDGKTDLLWRDTSGNTSIWFMNGLAVSSALSIGNIASNWTVQSVNAE